MTDVTAGSTDPADDVVPAPDSAAGTTPIPLGSPAPAPRLSLGDPLDGRAAEDRPESWGERRESESDRLAHYRTQTPPHHGG